MRPMVSMVMWKYLSGSKSAEQDNCKPAIVSTRWTRTVQLSAWKNRLKNFHFLSSPPHHNKILPKSLFSEKDVVSLSVSTSAIHNLYFAKASFVNSHQFKKSPCPSCLLSLWVTAIKALSRISGFAAKNRLQIRWRWLGAVSCIWGSDNTDWFS